MPRTIKNEHGERYAIDENDFLTDGVLIKVDLNDIIDLDLEGFLDRISEDAGFSVLMAQTYELEGHEGNTLLLRIRGDVSMQIDYDDDRIVGTCAEADCNADVFTDESDFCEEHRGDPSEPGHTDNPRSSYDAD